MKSFLPLLKVAESYLAVICRLAVRLWLLLRTVKFVLEQSQSVSGPSDKALPVWREQKYPARQRYKSGLACRVLFHGELQIC